MADSPSRKRKAEKTDEFFHILAKGQFLKVPKGDELDDRDFSAAKRKKRKVPSRRDLRRKARVERKAKRVAFFSKKKGQVSEQQNSPAKQNTMSSDSNKLDTTGNKKRKKKRKANKDVAESKHDYKQKLLEDNKKEDKEIKKLEKLLRLDKKKKIPSQFCTEGLDYLLDVCDPQMMQRNGDSEEEPEQRPKISGYNKANKSKAEAQDVHEQSYSEDECSDGNYTDTDFQDEERDLSFDDRTEIGEHGYNGDNKAYANDDDSDGDHNSYNDIDNGDILRSDEDNDEGDDVKCNDDDIDDNDDDDDDDENDDSKDKQVSENKKTLNSQKYLPPHLRKQQSSDIQHEHLNKIKRQMKGLLNRLSEGNMSVISNEIENLFIRNSRNDMNKILTDLTLDSCIAVSLMPDKLLIEHVMLLAILTSHVGIEVGAFFVERLAEVFDKLHDCEKDNYGEGKECVNAVTLFANLYNFKIIHCCLIYDIIRRLVDAFTEQDIELLLLLLKSTGAEIRRDDPASLKEIILQIQAKAAATSKPSINSRVRFMLEIISNLRNNNLRKIPGYDPSRIEHLRKVLRSVIRESSLAASTQLQISLEDLLKSDTKGRWWITGSTLSRCESEFQATSSTQKDNSRLLELARKQRMNTDVRKNVFLVIMTSEDYVDAFEKLMRLNLKDVQTREVIHVLIDCCLQEKTYNPYYAYLGQKFCEYSRSYQVTFQYSFWDKFKVVSDLSSHSVSNLSQLLAHLITSRALSLAILKVVNFVELDKPSIKVFTDLFHHVLLNYSADITRSVFERISAVPDLASLRQSLRIFIKHFVGKAKISKTCKFNDLEGRLKLVDGILGASDGIKL